MPNANSVVLELQRDALNHDFPVSTLLRKSMVVARKLKLEDFEEWITKELNGYESEPPAYRRIQGVPRGLNPYRGWIPLGSEDNDLMEALSSHLIHQSIAELEDLASGDEGSLHIAYPESIQRDLRGAVGFETQFVLVIGGASLAGILDTVRNTVLTWALELEEKGILGEGLSFTDREQQSAQSGLQSTNIFTGPIGSQQIAQNSPETIQIAGSLDLDIEQVREFLTELANKIGDLDLSGDLQEELGSEMATIDAQANSPRPKLRIVREGLSSIRRILEAASAPAAAELLNNLSRVLQ